MKLLSVLNVKSVTSAGTYAVAGIGFSLATLVMGKVLPHDEFATAVLLIALCNVGAATSPSGINGVVLRHDLRSDLRLLLVSCATALCGALVTVGIGIWLYAFEVPVVLVLFAAVFSGGVVFATKSSLQLAHRFQTVAAVTQSANGGLLLASLLMLAGVGRNEWFATAMVAAVFAFAAFGAWTWTLRHNRTGGSLAAPMWRDAVNFGGLTLAGEVMVQVERFLIPLALDTYQLAIFAVLASIALAPYRVLELGAGSTLPAQLRRTQGVAARRRLLFRDAAWLAVLSVGGGVLVVTIGSHVCRLVLVDVSFSWALMLSAVVGGVTRVLASVAQSLSAAFCSGQELRWVHATVWLAVVIATIGGYAMSAFGLPGLIYGVSCGWAFRAGVVFAISRRHLGSTGSPNREIESQ